jgi:hypothetical protein
MIAGVVIFAFNNEQIDYLALAEWTTRNVHRHLDLPVCVITDQTAIPSNYTFDHVVHATATDTHWRHFRDFEKSATWYNGNRVDAYELSPWDHTLVLDADYVVASDQLKCLLEADQDFLAHKTAYDVTDKANFDELNNFGRHQMPMWWATVMMFRKSKQAELIFECMQMIKDNWTHYQNLYGVYRPTYRNDHALSIALGIVNGHTLDHAGIPWSLASVTHDHKLTQINKDEYKVEYLTANKRPRWIKLTYDFHAMGKGHLGAIVANPC